MKRKPVRTAVFLVAALVFSMYLSVPAAASGFEGEWVCVAIDLGDGIWLHEYEGVKAEDVMTLLLGPGGSLQVTSFGESINGTWEEETDGVLAMVDGEAVALELREGRLVNEAEGVRFYLEKKTGETEAKASSGGLLSLIKSSRYAGKWLASGFDEGDGNLKTEIDGIPAAELMSFNIHRDGTLSMISMGIETPGTWYEITGGIHVTLDGVSTEMFLRDEQLVALSEGVTIPFIRVGQDQAAVPTPIPPSVFEGTWRAVSYQAAGMNFDAATLFQDGCTLTLRGDGTGTVFLTKDYSEQITWAEKDGELTLVGTYVFSSPQWDAAREELSIGYAMGTVPVIFKKDVEPTAAPTQEPLAEITAVPTPQPLAEITAVPTPQPLAELTAAPTPQPLVEPTDKPDVPAFGEGEELIETKLFSVRFPEGWTLAEGTLYDRDDYCAVQCVLPDQSGWHHASAQLNAAVGAVKGYREKIRQLTERAEKGGKGALETLVMGGIVFEGTEYENWGAKNAEYVARVPESRVTLTLVLEHPENIEDLQRMLDSVVFTLPSLDPPNVDPPLPEDGIPYKPQVSAVTTDVAQLVPRWLEPDESIVLDSIFDNHLALLDGKLYTLTGKTLRAFTVEDGRLVPSPALPEGGMRLEDKYEYLSAAKDGFLYLSQGIFHVLALGDDATMKNSLSGKLAMHPSGKWGITFWANSDPMKISALAGSLEKAPWVLSSLSDADKRQGRFGSITCVSISEDRIYVAGTDALQGGTNRVAIFDLDGSELASFGSDDWSAGDAFGSVTGIVETAGGLLVLDGNFRELKLFTREGGFLASVRCDELLGTDYPWPSSMIPYQEGVLIAAAQKRADESCEELLVFEVTGF